LLCSRLFCPTFTLLCVALLRYSSICPVPIVVVHYVLWWSYPVISLFSLHHCTFCGRGVDLVVLRIPRLSTFSGLRFVAVCLVIIGLTCVCRRLFGVLSPILFIPWYHPTTFPHSLCICLFSHPSLDVLPVLLALPLPSLRSFVTFSRGFLTWTRCTALLRVLTASFSLPLHCAIHALHAFVCFRSTSLILPSPACCARLFARFLYVDRYACSLVVDYVTCRYARCSFTFTLFVWFGFNCVLEPAVPAFTGGTHVCLRYRWMRDSDSVFVYRSLFVHSFVEFRLLFVCSFSCGGYVYPFVHVCTSHTGF